MTALGAKPLARRTVLIFLCEGCSAGWAPSENGIRQMTVKAALIGRFFGQRQELVANRKAQAERSSRSDYPGMLDGNPSWRA